MAIQKSITDEYGVTHSESYTKISMIHLVAATTVIQIEIYHNATTRSKSDVAQQKQPFIASTVDISKADTTTYFVDSVLLAENKSPISQAYAWLKTQTDIIGLDYSTGTTDV